MKKYLFTAIVALASVVYAANTPWDGKGNPNWNKTDKKLDVVYSASKTGSAVKFDYSWGAAHQNQIDYYKRTDIDTGWTYVNGTFEFTSAFVWTDFAAQLDSRKGSLGEIVEFGYYKIGADGVASDPIAMMKLVDGNTTVNSVIFQADEKIGVYEIVAGLNGKSTIITSTDHEVFEGASAAVPNVDTNSRGNAPQYFCLFDPEIGNISHYEYYLAGSLASSEGQSYEDFYNEVVKENGGNTNITNSDGTPAGNNVGGQPLPGLLTTIALGGAAVAGISKKRKNRKA